MPLPGQFIWSLVTRNIVLNVLPLYFLIEMLVTTKHPFGAYCFGTQCFWEAPSNEKIWKYLFPSYYCRLENLTVIKIPPPIASFNLETSEKIWMELFTMYIFPNLSSHIMYNVGNTSFILPQVMSDTVQGIGYEWQVQTHSHIVTCHNLYFDFFNYDVISVTSLTY